MKQTIAALLLILFVACTKEPLTAPAGTNQNPLTNTSVSYKDNSISVVDFKALAANQNIEVKFTTLYEKNIVKLEILRGLTANNLCSIYTQKVKSDSSSPVTYSTSDLNENKVNAVYYMVKYTLANGDWGYTPVFTLSL